MGMNRGHPHGLPKMLQHIQHGGTHPVKGQSPRLLFQRELNVVAAFPLKTDMTGRRRVMGQQAWFVDLKQQHLSPRVGRRLKGTLQRFVIPRSQVSLEPHHVHSRCHHKSFQPAITSVNTSTSLPTFA